VTLVDTSAWIEYLRATHSPAHEALRDLIRGDAELQTTEVVVMEVLAGGRDDDHLDRLRGLLARCRLLPVRGLDDYERAASLYRQCRRTGDTVRALTDCVIGAVALRTDVDVLHADRDFDVLARHTGLRIHATTARP